VKEIIDDGFNLPHSLPSVNLQTRIYLSLFLGPFIYSILGTLHGELEICDSQFKVVLGDPLIVLVIIV